MTELTQAKIDALMQNPVDITNVETMRIVVAEDLAETVDLAEPVDSSDD